MLQDFLRSRLTFLTVLSLCALILTGTTVAVAQGGGVVPVVPAAGILSALELLAESKFINYVMAAIGAVAVVAFKKASKIFEEVRTDVAGLAGSLSTVQREVALVRQSVEHVTASQGKLEAAVEAKGAERTAQIDQIQVASHRSADTVQAAMLLAQNNDINIERIARHWGIPTTAYNNETFVPPEEEQRFMPPTAPTSLPFKRPKTQG